MTNPNNAVRVSSRNGGRGSVYEANAWAQTYGNGILSGNGVTPSSGMVVAVGGTTACPDVVIAANASGYKIALDIVDSATLTVTKPSSNKRITAVVAYTNDLAVASTETNITGNPASCGLIVVNGTTSANPVNPTDAQIRTAITSDGGTGSSAAYAVVATILVTSSTSSITSGIITRQTALSGLIDIFYPVGCYYETSDTSFDPNTAWGGTWAEDTAGRVLVAKDSATFATVGNTGGEETHKLTTAEMPSHSHTNLYDYNGAGIGTASGAVGVGYIPSGGYGYGSITTGTAGSSGSHNNLQPYIVVKRWHRVN